MCRQRKRPRASARRSTYLQNNEYVNGRISSHQIRSVLSSRRRPALPPITRPSSRTGTACGRNPQRLKRPRRGSILQTDGQQYRPPSAPTTEICFMLSSKRIAADPQAAGTGTSETPSKRHTFSPRACGSFRTLLSNAAGRKPHLQRNLRRKGTIRRRIRDNPAIRGDPLRSATRPFLRPVRATGGDPQPVSLPRHARISPANAGHSGCR